MSEYITGSDEDLEAFRAQLGVIHKDPHIVLIGSFGRQAFYETFSWATEPLALDKTDWAILAEERRYKNRRDIDILGIGRVPSKKVVLSRPHEVDYEMQEYISPMRPIAISDGSDWHHVVNDRVFATRTRQLAGVPVRTLLVRTQLEIEQLASVSHIYDPADEEAQKYAASFAEFSRFAASLPRNSAEFPAEELYGPFEELHRRRTADS